MSSKRLVAISVGVIACLGTVTANALVAHTVRWNVDISIPPGKYIDVAARCPSDTVAVGGGWYTYDTHLVQISAARLVAGSNSNRFTVQAYNQDINTRTVSVAADCLSGLPSGAQVTTVSSNQSVPAQSAAVFPSPACPSGSVQASVGFSVGIDGVQVPWLRLSESVFYNATSAARTVVMYSSCLVGLNSGSWVAELDYPPYPYNGNPGEWMVNGGDCPYPTVPTGGGYAGFYWGTGSQAADNIAPTRSHNFFANDWVNFWRYNDTSIAPQAGATFCGYFP